MCAAILGEGQRLDGAVAGTWAKTTRLGVGIMARSNQRSLRHKCKK